MLNRQTLLFCILITIFTFKFTYSTLSLVEQCPGIDVGSITHNSVKHELSIILYYVSWSDSRLTKTMFDEVSKYYEGDAYFASIDCWHLACNCSKIYVGWGTPQTWPTIVVYYGTKVVFQYNGKMEFVHLADFIKNLMLPIDRIYNKTELRDLTAKTDAVILGVFPNTKAPQYRRFVNAGIRWLQTDPQRAYRFTLVLGNASYDILNVKQPQPPMMLKIRGSDYEVFNSTTDWTPNEILLWLTMDIKPKFSPSFRYPSMTKLATQIKSGAVLALFASNLPHNNNFYTVMDKQMYDYNNMEGDYKFCAKYWKKVANKPNFLAKKKYVQIIIDKIFNAQPDRCQRIEYLSTFNLANYYTMNSYLRDKIKIFSAGIGRLLVDKPAREQIRMYNKNKCARHPDYVTLEVQKAISNYIRKSSYTFWTESSTQRPNRTLSVMVLDTAEHRDFFDKHGISQINSNSALAIIVESNKERIFVMQEKCTFENLELFIKNYYENNLNPHQKTTFVRADLPTTANKAYIQEYNRRMFLDMVEKQNGTTVLFLYSPECALSAVMANTIIQLSAMLDSKIVKFVRLNTKTNDLPWEFVIPTTPSVIVFPNGRSTDSKVFPKYLKADVRNVYGFILAQLEPIDQVMLIMSNCRRIYQPVRLQKCLEFAKTLVLKHIGDHLKYWQMFENERQQIIERLKEFKDISLNIQQNIKL